MKQLVMRASAPTPSFFIKVRNICLLIGAIGAGILATPVALPATVTTIAGYLTVAGSIAAGISQLTTADTDPANPFLPKRKRTRL
jgi:hypothetical protein